MNVAFEEINQMDEFCEGRSPNKLLTAAQKLTTERANEAYRVIKAQEADISQFAIHGLFNEEVPYIHQFFYLRRRHQRVSLLNSNATHL